MNSEIVRAIVTEIEQLRNDDDTSGIALIIRDVTDPAFFSVCYVDNEYAAIQRAQSNSLPTYRSQYRVVKILQRELTSVIRYIDKSHGDEARLYPKLAPLWNILNDVKKDLSRYFDEERQTNDVIMKFNAMTMKTPKVLTTTAIPSGSTTD